MFTRFICAELLSTVVLLKGQCILIIIFHVFIFKCVLTFIFDIFGQLKEYSANIVLFFQDQLSFVAAMTNTQTATRRRRASAVSSSPEKSTASQLSVVAGANIMKTPELQCMKPLLRFLQLLCENHHTKMQV